MQGVSGLWLPVITPFYDGAIDFQSYDRLLEWYLAKGVSGFIPLGTTGESPTLEVDEMEAIVDRTLAVVGDRAPVFIGIGGNATGKVVKTIQRFERFRCAGILSVCPYYNRPGQDGLYEHFSRIAASTDRDILIYNIPYRTSVNLTNETLFRLAEFSNIVGVKDSCGDLAQSLDLLRNRPNGFSVLTGEDASYFTMLANGADGGILASCHLETDAFLDLRTRAANDHLGARTIWSRLEPSIAPLFREANPMPIKHCLWRQGLIRSPECRLPLTTVSESLASELDRLIGFKPSAESSETRSSASANRGGERRSRLRKRRPRPQGHAADRNATTAGR